MRGPLLGSVLMVLALGADAAAQRAVVVVRHAERLDASADSPLSSDGHARAAALAETLRAAGVTEILVTDRQRTQATAAPLAAALTLTPQVMKAADVEGLVARLKRAPADAVVLVVGHSNTVPQILTGLGWRGQVSIGDGQFDDLFLLTPRGESEPSVVRLKYGRATP